MHFDIQTLQERSPSWWWEGAEAAPGFVLRGWSSELEAGDIRLAVLRAPWGPHGDLLATSPCPTALWWSLPIGVQ